MRVVYAILVWFVLVLALASVLYFVLGTTAVLAFGGSLIGSALAMLVVFRVVEVEGYEHLIIRRGGNYRDPGVQGGRFFLIRTVDVPIRVDMRPRTETVESIECFTHEGIDLDVSYFLIWRVIDPLAFLRDSPGPEATPSVLGQVATQTLMDAVGRLSYNDVLQRRQGLVRALRGTLRALPDIADWGIEIVQVGLGETKLPQDIAEAMARQVAATLIAQARLTEDLGAARAIGQMPAMVQDPGMVDRVVLLQIMRSIADALGQRK